jgi:predicted transcriptional regulator
MKARPLKIEIKTLDEEIEETASLLTRAEQGKSTKLERKLVFRSIEDLRSVLTPGRLRLIHLIYHKKPESVYELAQLARRDRKAIITDLDILQTLGLVHLTEESSEGRKRSIPQVDYSRIDISVEV